LKAYNSWSTIDSKYLYLRQRNNHFVAKQIQDLSTCMTGCLVKKRPIYLGEFCAIFLKKMRPNHLGDIFPKKFAQRQKIIAQMAKFRPIWSHCVRPTTGLKKSKT
jgi:hypothetical protein